MESYYIDLIDEYLNELTKANEANNEELFKETLIDLANDLYNDVILNNNF